MMLPIRRLAVLLLLILGALVQPGGAVAQGSPSSTEGALFLLLPVGAKGVAMGRAMTTLQGSESAFWNPAGLAAVDQSQVILFRGDHAVGTGTTLSGIVARPGLGAVGLSYLLLDVGDQQLRDETGNVLGTVSVRNHLGVVSGAARVFDRLDAGVNFKVVRFQLSCRGQCPDAGTTATTYAVDLGLQLLPAPGFPLRFGAMVAHVGPKLQVFNREQADPLPARIRLGVAYDFLEDVVERPGLSGLVTVEVEDRLRDVGASPSLYMGTEFAAGTTDALFLRAGFVVSDLEQEDGARVGLGLRYERFDLSIAKSLAVSTLTGETEPVHVSFAIRF